MAPFINTFNLFVFFIFSFCYMYQVVYAIVVLVKDHIIEKSAALNFPQHRFAVMISGRNEAKVIGELIKSILAQDYPKKLIDIFVVADNCTDNTAAVARECGAHVFERENKELVGKSYALNYALKRIRTLYGNEEGRTDYDAYFVFDADNLLDPGYVSAINRSYNEGNRIITCYRNSKNYDSNWISAGSALWFLREAKFLSNARSMCGSSCAISGTGFMISAEILETNEGWIHHLLTEDIEFSTDCIAHGIKIGYCADAFIYDEQPTTMKDSWRQRLRWAKGFYQVLLKYGKQLFRNIFKGKQGMRWSSFDMYMTIAPAMLLTILAFFINAIFCSIGIIQLTTIAPAVQQIAATTAQHSSDYTGFIGLARMTWHLISGLAFKGDALSVFTTDQVATMLAYAQARATIITSIISLTSCFLSFGIVMFFFGLLTTVVERRHIHASTWNKVKYVFTFPIFMLTYIPIALCAVFSKVEWKPITHNVVRSVSDVVGDNAK